jgi:hypothetical protein
LLPSTLAGAHWLTTAKGWQPVYVDNTAVVLVRTLADYPQLAPLQLPISPDDTPLTPQRLPFPRSAAKITPSCAP